MAERKKKAAKHPHDKSTPPRNPMTDPPAREPGQRSSTRAGREKLPICGAANRDGNPCARPAGWGTNHTGEGRCKLHGGVGQHASQRYQQLKAGERLGELITQFSEDEDPHNLLPELALLRALVTDYVERYAEMRDALLAWHASYTVGYEEAVKLWRSQLADWVEEQDRGEKTEPPPIPVPEAFMQKPRQIMDIVAAAGYIDKIGALSERIEKRRREGLVSLSVLDSVLEQLGIEVVAAAREVELSDVVRTALLAAVERRWGNIRIDPASTALPGAAAGGARALN